MKIRLWALSALLTVSTLGIAHAYPGDTVFAKIVVRWCPEDALQVGVGDFDGNRWTRYLCIPRDDVAAYLTSGEGETS